MIKSIAIGSFDGMHKAHQELISRADGVVVIERNSGTLTAGYKRTFHTNKPMFFYSFDKIKYLTPQEFTHKLSLDFPSLEKIIVGYDFAFGKHKSGDSEMLKRLFGGDVEVVDEIKINGIGVHSKVIREFLANGDIKRANQFLGYEYQISGTIIKGQGLGKNELVPTINIEVDNQLLPSDGIYATKTKIEDVWHSSVSFVGNRVSTDGKFAVETHILDANIGEISGSIAIKFIDFMRQNRKYDNLADLKKQIHTDINQAREINER